MGKYKYHNFFFLRRPLLSIRELDRFEEGIIQNPEVFDENIVRLFRNPVMLEALYLASPNFYDHFSKVLSGDYSGDSAKSIYQSLYKYFLRMTSRPTPYGLFAGGLTGVFDNATDFKFKSTIIKREARLDMNYVNELYLHISTLPYIKKQLKFKINSSLYTSGDKYRYISYKVKNKKREFVISAVAKSDHLGKVFEKCGCGALISELAACLLADDITDSEAENYINNLIEAQILVSELEPTSTGSEYYNLMVDKLSQLKNTESMVSLLKRIQSNLELQNADISKYLQIKNILIENNIPTEATDLIQVDTFFECSKATLSKEIPETILKELEELSPLIQKHTNTNLENFKQKFYTRYEEKEVPLLEALDSELGIGYDKATSGNGDYLPLIENVQIPGINTNRARKYGGLEKITHAIYDKAINEKLKIVKLTSDNLDDINKLKFNAVLPDSFFVIGKLESSGLEELNNNEFVFTIKALSGPTCGRLLGRFCHGDKKLYEVLKEAIKEEETLEGDKVFAEVAHIPEARIGNVLARPHLRNYEIPFMVGSMLPEENQILPNDLYVSVPQGNRIKIFSKKLGKEIIPRITNAHNFSDGLSLYKFLGDLQFQNQSVSLNWSWGIHETSIFLPRIQYKHLILERARWNLTKENIPLLNKTKLITTRVVIEILESLDTPQWVVLLEGDNELPINTKNPIAIKILTDKLKKFGSITLVEYLGNHKSSWLQNEQNQPLANELVIPFIKNKISPNQTSISNVLSQDVNIKRTFLIGSEWLYLKIYTGTKTADKVLIEIVKPLVEEASKEGLIEKWFFIRYNDPDNHLRLRFYSSNPSVLWKVFLERLSTNLNPWVENRQIINYQIETYKRELERYSPAAIEEVEEWFFADSKFILELIDAIEGEEGEEYRWLLGARAIDGMLNGLGYTLEDKVNILSTVKDGFFTEFNGNTALMVNLNDNYRKISNSLASIMDKENDKLNEIDEFAIHLDFHTQNASNLNRALKSKISSEQLYNITPSLIHMFMNRLFISNQRTHELVLYHYLFKFYNSAWARQKKNMVQNEELE